MMRGFYSILIGFFSAMLPVLGWLSPKLKAFSEDRLSVFKKLEATISASDRVIWFHAASLGEYEQAVPVMEAVKKLFPKHKILLSFFSPSGYRQKKNNPFADVTVYLPLDTASNAKRFVQLAHPELSLFIKYEFWPNFLNSLHQNKSKILLISGVFRPNQPFFKWYGGFMVDALKTFDHLFVQDQSSFELAESLGFNNVSLSGDTRFDRVSKQLEMDNTLPEIERFKNGKKLLVCGSTWPEDDALLIDFINKNAAPQVKIVIAPHQIIPQKIQRLKEEIKTNVALFSEKTEVQLENVDVFILDTIGMLGRAYSYADVAYVGGAAGTTGLHNILEPATFGIPILSGKHITKFPEAQQLQRLAGLFTVDNTNEINALLKKLFENEVFRRKTGMICGHFVQNQAGATMIIINYLKDQTLTA